MIALLNELQTFQSLKGQNEGKANVIELSHAQRKKNRISTLIATINM